MINSQLRHFVLQHSVVPFSTPPKIEILEHAGGASLERSKYRYFDRAPSLEVPLVI